SSASIAPRSPGPRTLTRKVLLSRSAVMAGGIGPPNLPPLLGLLQGVADMLTAAVATRRSPPDRRSRVSRRSLQLRPSSRGPEVTAAATRGNPPGPSQA